MKEGGAHAFVAAPEMVHENGTFKILVTFKSFCPLPYYLASRDYSVFVPCLSTAARAVMSKPE